jgi:chemotaxis protein MotB
MRTLQIIFSLFIIVALSACSAKKELVEAEDNIQRLRTQQSDLQADLNECEKQKSVAEALLDEERNKNKALEGNLQYFKTLYQDMMDRLALISEAGAENIQKSLQAIQEQNKYIQDLNYKIQKKDSLAFNLMSNLKRSLEEGIADDDVTIEVKKGVVYVSLSDKMLFKSASYDILSEADRVLGKVAQVIKDHKQFDILVEGHTDNKSISTDCLKDNWDLSVMRSTAVVRQLQEKHGVDPKRMTAGGRSKYIPKATNETVEGRAENRRTEIIILPKLDEFFDLLNSGGPSEEAENKK